MRRTKEERLPIQLILIVILAGVGVVGREAEFPSLSFLRFAFTLQINFGKKIMKSLVNTFETGLRERDGLASPLL